MNEKKKQGLLEISVRTVKIVLCLSLVFNALFYVYFGMLNKSDVLAVEPVRYIESWIVTCKDGGEITTGRDYVNEKEYYQNVSARATLPENIEDNEYLFFDTRKDIAIYVNGELRYDFVEKRDVKIPGGSVKSFYVMVPLKKSDSGTEIKMVRLAEKSDGQIVSETFISTRFGAFGHMMRNDGLSFIQAFVVLIFSFVVLIVSVVLRFLYKMKISMTYGALGIFIIASWLLTDSPVFPFVFGVYYVNGVLNYLLCLMIPFAPAIYLNAVQGGRYKIGMSIIMLASAANAVVLSFLHFSGICPFYNVRTVANLILVTMSAYAIAMLTYDAVKGNAAKYRYTCIGFFGFLVCSLIELSLILIVDLKSAIPMVIGLGFLLIFVVIQQVDDLRKINVEKQHAIDVSEAKTRFLASMSHEIRTPINAILGMNEMILRESKDKEIREYSRTVKTSGKMLLMLVNDVLDFSKIEAGKLEIVENRFHLSEMLFDVVSLVKERADAKRLELKTEITDKIPEELVSDEFRIRQILVNLINNAVKYTEKGSVTLLLGGTFAGDGFEMSLRVKDTGKGIRKEDQEHLFEAFSRADVKSNVNIEGTGLGLAIVKSIVDSMKGSVGVESEYGVGSEFWVKLPVKYVGDEMLHSDFMSRRSAREENQEGESFTAPNAKILAVDDNQSNLTIVKLFLKQNGIEPDLCSDGNRAVELCREKQYDLLLLDHMMPAPDGIETLHAIRNDASSLNRNTKAIVLTANAVAGSRQKYLEEGFDDYLTKPLDSKALEQTVKNALPKEKVNLATAKERQGEAGASQPAEEAELSLKKRLTSIKGFDYDAALCYCGGDEDFLGEIVATVAADCPERLSRMRKSLAEKNLKDYEIDAHSVKSTMATIGMKAFSERARKHEFAAKEKDLQFIDQDAEKFLDEYAAICKKLEG